MSVEPEDPGKTKYINHHLIFYLKDGAEFWGYVRGWTKGHVMVQSATEICSLPMSQVMAWEMAEWF